MLASSFTPMLGYENKLCSFYFVCYASSFTPMLGYENKICSFYFICYASSFTPMLGYENKICSFLKTLPQHVKQQKKHCSFTLICV